MPLPRHSHSPPQHMTMPALTVCQCQLIYCFIQTQHQHHPLSSFSIFVYFPSRIISGIMLRIHTELLAMQSSGRQPLPALSMQQPTTFPSLNPSTSCSGSQQPHILHLCSPCHLDMYTLLLFSHHYITLLPASIITFTFLCVCV